MRADSIPFNKCYAAPAERYFILSSLAISIDQWTPPPWSFPHFLSIPIPLTISYYNITSCSLLLHCLAPPASRCLLLLLLCWALAQTVELQNNSMMMTMMMLLKNWFNNKWWRWLIWRWNNEWDMKQRHGAVHWHSISHLLRHVPVAAAAVAAAAAVDSWSSPQWNK